MIASGPSLVIRGIAAWIVLIGSVVVAMGVIWKAFLPIVRAAVKFNETWPTLVQIGEDFRSNHGSSLKDIIQRTDENVDALGTVTILVDGKPVETPINEVLAELHKYAHENNHALKGRMDVVEGWQKLYEKMLTKIPEPSSPE